MTQSEPTKADIHTRSDNMRRRDFLVQAAADWRGSAENWIGLANMYAAHGQHGEASRCSNTAMLSLQQSIVYSSRLTQIDAQAAKEEN